MVGEDPVRQLLDVLVDFFKVKAHELGVILRLTKGFEGFARVLQDFFFRFRVSSIFGYSLDVLPDSAKLVSSLGELDLDVSPDLEPQVVHGHLFPSFTFSYDRAPFLAKLGRRRCAWTCSAVPAERLGRLAANVRMGG